MKAKAVRDTVRSWVEGVLKITTIHGYPNALAPAEPYAVVYRTISDAVHLHPAGEDFIEADGKITQAPQVETYWRFIVDVFGPDADDTLQKIKTAANVPTALWPLRPLALAETTRIMTQHELRDQEFKDRAQMTIEVRGIVRDGIVIDTIDEQKPVLTPA